MRRGRATGRTGCIGKVFLPRASARCILCRPDRSPVSHCAFGEGVLCVSSPPPLVARPFIQVLLFANAIPVPPASCFHTSSRSLPSQRKAFLKRRQRERSVDQDLLPCAAACHPNVRRYWVSTDHVDDHAPALLCFLARRRNVSAKSGAIGKLVTGHFQLWVGAAPRPKTTFHFCTLTRKTFLLIDSWNCPACFVFQNAQKYIQEVCSKLWVRLPTLWSVFNARPPADCSMAPFQKS